MAHRQEEGTLLRQGTAVADHREGIHLQAVVVVEAQRFVTDHTAVQLETACLQPLTAAGVAAVEDGHVILRRHRVDGTKQGKEILLRVDVLLPVGGKQDIIAFPEVQTGVDVRSLDTVQILMQHFRHGRPRHIGALLGHTRSVQVTAGMFRVAHVHIGDG